MTIGHEKSIVEPSRRYFFNLAHVRSVEVVAATQFHQFPGWRRMGAAPVWGAPAVETAG
jgi:hypothetical protein